MTGWPTLTNAAISFLMVAGVSITVSGPTAATPIISAPTIHQAMQRPSASSKEQETEDALQQIEGNERSPFVILIGARQHLFDGQFLCKLSDNPPLLSHTM